MPQCKSGSTREIHLDAPLIAPDGTLVAMLANVTGPKDEKPPATVSVPLDKGLEVLVQTGSFEANLARGLALLWIRMAMIAAMGLAANTFLSGPIAAFFLLGVLVTGLANSFVASLVAPSPMRFPIAGQPPGAPIVEMASRGLQQVLRLIPDFEDTDPAKDLLIGREISATRVGWQALCDLGLRAGLLFAIGLFAFRRREIGLPAG